MANGKRKSSFDEKMTMLYALAEKQKRVSNQEISTLFGAHEDYVFTLVLMIPFLQPMSIPGLSSVIGLITAICGACVFAGRRIWLPKRFLARSYKAKTIKKIVNFWHKYSEKSRWFIRKRGRYIVKDAFMKRFNGFLIVISSLVLMLPLPIPGTNTCPAVTIFLISLGSIKEDGLVVFLGYLGFFVTLAYTFVVFVWPLVYFMNATV